MWDDPFNKQTKKLKRFKEKKERKDIVCKQFLRAQNFPFEKLANFQSIKNSISGQSLKPPIPQWLFCQVETSVFQLPVLEALLPVSHLRLRHQLSLPAHSWLIFHTPAQVPCHVSSLLQPVRLPGSLLLPQRLSSQRCAPRLTRLTSWS